MKKSNCPHQNKKSPLHIPHRGPLPFMGEAFTSSSVHGSLAPRSEHSASSLGSSCLCQRPACLELGAMSLPDRVLSPAEASREHRVLERMAPERVPSPTHERFNHLAVRVPRVSADTERSPSVHLYGLRTTAHSPKKISPKRKSFQPQAQAGSRSPAPASASYQRPLSRSPRMASASTGALTAGKPRPSKINALPRKQKCQSQDAVDLNALWTPPMPPPSSSPPPISGKHMHLRLVRCWLIDADIERKTDGGASPPPALKDLWT